MIRVNHRDGTAKPFIGMSKRWDCPACRRNKFLDKIEHLVSIDKMAMSIEEHPGSVRAFADDLQEGCFVVYLRTKRALVVTTPKVLPDATLVDSREMLWECIAIMDREGVTRMVINDYWKAPESEPAEQTVRYARGCDTMDEVDEVLQEIGLSRRYSRYDLNGLSPREVVERLDEVLYERQSTGIDPLQDPSRYP